MEQLTEEQVISKIDSKFKEATKGFALDVETKSALDALRADYNKLKEDTALETEAKFKSLEDILAIQGDMINSMKAAKAVETKSGTIYDQVKEIFEKNQEGLNAFVKKSAPFKMELKAAGTMLVSTNVTGSTTLLPTPIMTPGYNPARRNPTTFLDVTPIGRTSSARVSYVDQVSADGTAATTAEGSGKPAIDVDFKVSTSSAIKIAATTKISDEMLDDIDFMAKAVSDELMSRVRLATSGNIYTYITSGMTPGYTEVASTYLDYFSLARQANIYDIGIAGKGTIDAANHNANTMFLNPLDYAKLGLVKTTAAEYTQPEMSGALGLEVAGLKVVSSNAVASGKYLICDIDKLNILMYQDLMVEAGWENDDFTKNLRTFRGEMRVHYYVKDNDKTAFLFGDIATSVAYMTAAS